MRRVFLFLFFVFPFVVERRGGLNAFTSCSGGAGSCIISCSLARRRYSSASQLKPSLCLLTRRARITLTVLPKHTDVTNPSPRDQFIDFFYFFMVFFGWVERFGRSRDMWCWHEWFSAWTACCTNRMRAGKLSWKKNNNTTSVLPEI